jgi:hypothetical protein
MSKSTGRNHCIGDKFYGHKTGNGHVVLKLFFLDERLEFFTIGIISNDNEFQTGELGQGDAEGPI